MNTQPTPPTALELFQAYEWVRAFGIIGSPSEVRRAYVIMHRMSDGFQLSTPQGGQPRKIPVIPSPAEVAEVLQKRGGRIKSSENYLKNLAAAIREDHPNVTRSEARQAIKQAIGVTITFTGEKDRKDLYVLLPEPKEVQPWAHPPSHPGSEHGNRGTGQPASASTAPTRPVTSMSAMPAPPSVGSRNDTGSRPSGMPLTGPLMTTWCSLDEYVYLHHPEAPVPDPGAA